jgi:hypothetical protein
VYIEKRIDKKIGRIHQTFPNHKLNLGKRRRKTLSTMCCGAKFELKSAWQLCNENTHHQPNCHPRLT